MAIQTFNIGSSPNDKTGDVLRLVGQKLNANFQELDTRTASAQSLASSANAKADAAQAKADAALPSSQKGVANGVAPLGPDGQLAEGIIGTSDKVPEGEQNLYFTNARAKSAVGPVIAPYAASAIPTENVGPIEVNGLGLMEWNGSTARYESVGVPHGQCRLVLSSPTQLLLVPYGGKYLMIGGRVYVVPAAGVPLTATGLVGGGNYYVFAKDNGSGGVALEALQWSTGAQHSPDALTGVEALTGDRSRTFVGQFQTGQNGQFIESATSRQFASWFNRKRCVLASGGGTMQTASQSFVLTSWVTNCMPFAGEVVTVRMYGVATSAASMIPAAAMIAVNGTPQGAAGVLVQPYAASQYGSLAQNYRFTPTADGVASAGVAVRVSGATTGTFTLEVETELWV